MKSFKIGLYARVSTEEQAENPEGSIKNQEQRLREYVKFRNADGGAFGEVVEVFIDPGISAKDMKRPALQRLLGRIRERQIDLVMVTDLSRFTRSTKDFSILWDFMQKHGCKFQSLRENFDSTTAAGEMIMFTLANFAQFERKQTAERISHSFLARAKRGLYNGGSVPLGYRIDPANVGRLLVVEDEAEVVRKVFRAFLKTGTLSETARALNQEKVNLRRTMQGAGGYRAGHFRVANVYGILTQKAYLGVRVYREKGEARETKAAWDGIVNEALFRRVEKKLRKNKSAKKPHRRERYPYLLTGICFCKACGDRLIGKSAHGNGGKIGYYDHGWATQRQAVLSKKILHCEPARVLAKKIEPVVWGAVKEFLTDRQVMGELLRLARKGQKQEVPERERLQQKLRGLENQTALLAERLASLPKEVDPKPIYEQLAKMQGLAADYREKIAASVAEEQDEPVDLTDLQKFAGQISALLAQEADPQVKALVIEKVVEKVLVTKTGVEIYFYAGKGHYKRELALEAADSLAAEESSGKGNAAPLRRPAKALPKYREAVLGIKKPAPHFLVVAGSNSFTNGGHCRGRTCDIHLVRVALCQLS
jgi:site-specific DNA recombinase